MFVDKYRPIKVSEMILTSEVKKLITGIKKKKAVPNMIFHGGVGTGKTTLARALCNDMNIEVLELNASLDSSTDNVIKAVMNFSTNVSLTSQQKVILLDESDNMSHKMQKVLRGVIEKFSNSCRFIFTANVVERLLEPIQSRCTLVEFKIANDKKVEKSILNYCVTILRKEKIKFKQEDLLNHVQHYLPDIRKLVAELEMSSNSGSFAFDCNTTAVSKTTAKGDLTIDMGKCKKLILRPGRSKNWMMQVFKDGKKHRKSSEASERKIAELKLEDYFNEIYADEPSKDQILESIATMVKALSHLRGVVDRMK